MQSKAQILIVTKNITIKITSLILNQIELFKDYAGTFYLQPVILIVQLRVHHSNCGHVNNIADGTTQL